MSEQEQQRKIHHTAPNVCPRLPIDQHPRSNECRSQVTAAARRRAALYTRRPELNRPTAVLVFAYSFVLAAAIDEHLFARLVSMV